jgi:hypothetical protein
MPKVGLGLAERYRQAGTELYRAAGRREQGRVGRNQSAEWGGVSTEYAEESPKASFRARETEVQDGRRRRPRRHCKIHWSLTARRRALNALALPPHYRRSPTLPRSHLTGQKQADERASRLISGGLDLPYEKRTVETGPPSECGHGGHLRQEAGSCPHMQYCSCRQTNTRRPPRINTRPECICRHWKRIAKATHICPSRKAGLMQCGA